MRGTTHMAGGAAAAAVCFAISYKNPITPPLILAAMGAGTIGGLLPDIDHPSSKISKVLKPVSALVTLIFSHRGLFHSPFLYLLLWTFWIAFCSRPHLLIWGNMVFIGIASHLLLDMLNPTGIPLFLPFDSRRRHIARIRTGSKGEMLIRVLLIALCFVLCIFLVLR